MICAAPRCVAGRYGGDLCGSGGGRYSHQGCETSDGKVSSHRAGFNPPLHIQSREERLDKGGKFLWSADRLSPRPRSPSLEFVGTAAPGIAVPTANGIANFGIPNCPEPQLVFEERPPERSGISTITHVLPHSRQLFEWRIHERNFGEEDGEERLFPSVENCHEQTLFTAEVGVDGPAGATCSLGHRVHRYPVYTPFSKEFCPGIQQPRPGFGLALVLVLSHLPAFDSLLGSNWIAYAIYITEVMQTWRVGMVSMDEFSENGGLLSAVRSCAPLC